MITIEFYRDATKPSEFRWRLKSKGRIIADSAESYKRLGACKRAPYNAARDIAAGKIKVVDSTKK